MRRLDANTEGGKKEMNSERDDFIPDVFSAPSAHRGTPRTTVTESIVKMLNDFGLNVKEAQLYVHLLRYGPKRAGDLARSLKTYREDVYRRCARLIDIGMATKTSEVLTRYVPIELDGALNNVLLAHKYELRRLQRVKQKVVGDDSNILLRRENEHSSFKLVKNVGELVTAISQLINSAEASIIFVAHPRFHLISMGGFQNHLRCAVARDVRARGALDISPRNALVAREYLGCGVELRHKDHYSGMTMVIADGKRSISVIYPYLKNALSLDENVAALWSDNVAQAEFLTSAFEMTWTQAINAEEHIDQQLGIAL
jgi:sugar-specific transcriptional regulator TrmB